MGNTYALIGAPDNGEYYIPDDGEYYKKSYIETVNGVRIKMIYVAGGKFYMGCRWNQIHCDEDEIKVREIQLDDYYISDIEIPQCLWYAVMGKDIYYYYRNQSWGILRERPIRAYVDPIDEKSTYLAHPMVYVSWNDAFEFCQKLSQMTGKNYRLPTEAQWEYAARGGKYDRYYIYSGSDNIDIVAHYGYGDEQRGAFLCRGHAYEDENLNKKCNQIELYNMSGNVDEWCRDWYAEYDSLDYRNPQGPKKSPTGLKVVRGGDWFDPKEECRVTARKSYAPDWRLSTIGFRVVCEP